MEQYTWAGFQIERRIELRSFKHQKYFENLEKKSQMMRLKNSLNHTWNPSWEI